MNPVFVRTKRGRWHRAAELSGRLVPACSLVHIKKPYYVAEATPPGALLCARCFSAEGA